MARPIKIAVFLALFLSPLPVIAGSGDNLDAVSGNISYDTIQKITGDKREEEVLTRVWPYLRQAGKAGRLYYSVPCALDTGYPYYPYPFPSLSLHMPAEGAAGLDAIQQIFQYEKSVKVDENPKGLINIQIGKIPETILNTRISIINFTPEQRYYDWAAMRAIRGSPEVIAKLDKPSKNWFSLPGSWLGGALEGPHLPQTLTNITFDDALDAVAQTFQGIVVFGTCNDKNWYKAYFTGGYNYDGVNAQP